MKSVDGRSAFVRGLALSAAEQGTAGIRLGVLSAAATDVLTRLQESNQWHPGCVIPPSMCDRALSPSAAVWKKTLDSIQASNFQGTCRQKCLELSRIWLNHFRPILDVMFEEKSLADVRKQLESIFWISSCPERSIEVWMFAAFLMHLGGLEKSGSQWEGAANRLRMLWKYAKEHLSEEGSCLERFRDFPCYGDGGGSGLSRWDGPGRALRAADFARRINGQHLRRGFLTKLGESSRPEISERQMSEKLRELLTDEQLKAMRVWKVAGEDSSPNFRLQDDCPRDYLELAAALCLFVKSPFGGVRLDLRDGWVRTLDEVEQEKLKVITELRTMKWTAKPLILDVWSTAYLLSRAKVELSKLKSFCNNVLKYVPGPNLECFNLGNVHLYSYSKRGHFVNLDDRLEAMDKEPISFRDFAANNVARSYPGRSKRHRPDSGEETHAELGPTVAKRHAAGPTVAIRHAAGPTVTIRHAGPRPLLLQKLSSSSPWLRSAVSGLSAVQDDDESQEPLLDMYLEQFSHWATAVSDLLETRCADGSYFIPDSQVPSVATYLQDFSHWAEDWKKQIGQMYILATLPDRAKAALYSIFMAHALDFLQVQPSRLAEFMLTRWQWPNVELALSEDSHDAREVIAHATESDRRDTLVGLLENARRKELTEAVHGRRLQRQADDIASELVDMSFSGC